MEGSLYEVLAISCRTAAANDGLRPRIRTIFEQLAQAALHGCHGISLIGRIVREKEVLVPIHGHDLGGRRTRIYTQKHLHASRMQRRKHHQMVALGFAPRLQLLTVGEDRRQ